MQEKIQTNKHAACRHVMPCCKILGINSASKTNNVNACNVKAKGLTANYWIAKYSMVNVYAGSGRIPGKNDFLFQKRPEPVEKIPAVFYQIFDSLK